MMKANPDKVRMSTAGAGTAGHFAGEMFIAMAGIKPAVVHYKGGGPAIDAVVGNDSQWTCGSHRRPHAACAQRQAQGPRDGQPDAAGIAPGRADRRRIRLPPATARSAGARSSCPTAPRSRSSTS